MSTFTFPCVISDADMTAALTKLKDSGLLFTFLFILDAEEKKRIRGLGTKYEGFSGDIDKAATMFPDTVPLSNPLAEYESKIDSYDKLSKVEMAILSYLQMVQDTKFKLGGEILAAANVYYNSMKRLSKNDVAMAETMAKLQLNYNKKSHSSPKIIGIGASGSLQIQNVVTGTELTNKGQGVISFKPGNDLAGRVRIQNIVVDPMCSATIPKYWTSIEVTNMSTTLETSVSVRIK